MSERSGLKFVRIQCNYSMRALADKLSITKGILSRWENGEKIPENRLIQLSKLLGIDVMYIKGEIDDEMKQEIISKPKFSTNDSTGTTYSYQPIQDAEQIYVSFSDEAFKTSQERCDEMKKQAKVITTKVKELLAVDECTDEEQFRISHDILTDAIKHIELVKNNKKANETIGQCVIESPLADASFEDQVELWKRLVQHDNNLRYSQFLISRNTGVKSISQDPEYDWDENDEEDDE